jgi:crotonobetainyl-CoA:carnitine CoA-transferase CaiB-like acyl-CoA transferase
VTAPGPLSGLLVADFSRVLAGPLATMTLGDLGADVIKVERPDVGDDTRGWGPPFAADGQATYFLSVNRNKRSLAVDLSTVEGQAAALELALEADILVENFPPGTMERFGLGYEQLNSSRLIYASVTGFGRDSRQPGYDFLIQAVGGLMSITGPSDGEPTKVGVALVDVLAGQQLTSGILAALYARERTGRGQRVEVSLLGSLLAGLVNQASGLLNAGVVPGRMGNRHPSITPYETLPAQDGPFAVAVGNQAQFERFCAALGLTGALGEAPGATTVDARGDTPAEARADPPGAPHAEARANLPNATPADARGDTPGATPAEARADPPGAAPAGARGDTPGATPADARGDATAETYADPPGYAPATVRVDPRFRDNAARVANRDVLIRAIEAVTTTRPAQHWIDVLTAAKVPCGPVNDLAQAFDLAERLGLDPVVELGDTKTVASPIRLSDTPVSYRLPPPALPKPG